MRLDHLLSKEHRDAERHHEPASIERIEGEAQGWNIDIRRLTRRTFTSTTGLPVWKVDEQRVKRRNTLLGPEGTGNRSFGTFPLEPPS